MHTEERAEAFKLAVHRFKPQLCNFSISVQNLENSFFSYVHMSGDDNTHLEILMKITSGRCYKCITYHRAGGMNI